VRVYAEYIPNDNIRRKTLLQFGESIDLIGSAVLTNPGSAYPISNIIDDNIIINFYNNIHKENIEYSKSWYLFNNDPTMDQLEKVFNGWYINVNHKITKLNGIIQLFNCFYFMNPNRKNAMMQFSNKSKFVFNESHYFLDKPVYFGWGDLDSNLELKNIAKNIFMKYNCNYTPIYNNDFYKNSFYHPGYINRAYKTNENLKKHLKDFIKS